MRIFGLSLLIALLLCIFPAPSNAQINLDQAGDATLSFAPEYPRPNDTVTIKLRSFAADLQSADILWEVDGSVVKEGMGVDSITVTAPAAGKTMAIRATALSNGRRFVAETSFTPAGVALLWEGVGYTPPFYKGKTLLAYGGVARVVAIPDFRSSSGAKVAVGDLIYNWEKNGRKMLAVSGLGKSSADFLQDSYLRGEDTITVEVRDPVTNALAKASVVIAPVQNIIGLYEESPSLGRLYHKALGGTMNLTKAELSLIIEPYFMTISSREKSGALYVWNQNGFRANSNAARITISNPQEGRTALSASVTSNTKLLQGGNTSLGLIFQSIVDTTSSGNLFSNEN